LKQDSARQWLDRQEVHADHLGCAARDGDLQPPTRRGALSRGAEIKEQLEVLAGVAAGGQSEEEKWSV
jgi:hypothetical protein